VTCWICFHIGYVLLLENIWKTIITQVCKFPPIVRQTVDIKLDSAGYTVSNK